MATDTTPPASGTAARPTGRPQPPEEQFWQRYSPHGEFPLSGVASLALHGLVIGLMLLFGLYLAHLFYKPKSTIPVDAVTLSDAGGGGNPLGTAGGGKGVGHGKEMPAQARPGTTEPRPVTAPLPKLSQIEISKLQEKFDPADVRYLKDVAPEKSADLAALRDKVTRLTLPDPDGTPRAKGKGGTGTGGGAGKGGGAGDGDGTKEGHARLTQREKRMLRWAMTFNTMSGADYVAQLRGLGAVVAIPVRETATGPEYEVVKDLGQRPVQLEKRDLGQMNLIYWFDRDPRSVQHVAQVLGLKMVPSHFVAFMPQALEEKMFRMEKEYVRQHFPGLTEDQIGETRFRAERSGGSYVPRLVSVTPKGRP